MSYIPATRQLDLNDRPKFLITDPVTMNHPVAMLHHRISWNALGGAINQVLSGAADSKIVNFLLRLSPGNSGDVIRGFNTALDRVLSNQPLTGGQIEAIQTVEQLLFSLPCNLFLGLSEREDDPKAGIDFLPADITATGALPCVGGQLTALGAIQQVREKLMNRLLNATAPFAFTDIGTCCTALKTLWVAQTPPAAAVIGPPAIPQRNSMEQATGFQPADWAPGAAPFAGPPYRNWPGPLTAPQCAALNATVINRVRTGYQ